MTSGTRTSRSCWGPSCRTGRSTSLYTAGCWSVSSLTITINSPLKVNSFALRADNNGEEENVGTALYRANSIFDHSCRPNATTIFSGKKLLIKSMISSPCMELSKFFISYLDQSLCGDARRSKLSGTWYFQCGCEAGDGQYLRGNTS